MRSCDCMHEMCIVCNQMPIVSKTFWARNESIFFVEKWISKLTRTEFGLFKRTLTLDFFCFFTSFMRIKNYTQIRGEEESQVNNILKHKITPL